MKHDALIHTVIPELGSPRSGKVREIYEGETTLTLITTDRISAFNHIFPDPIPDKGRILNGISKFWFEHTNDIIANHLISAPDPNVFVVKKCKPLLIEVVVRRYIVGSLWRDYAKGSRNKCGELLPEGLIENDKLPHPIITPTIKSHDDPEITPEELIGQGFITRELWKQVCLASLKLFQRGTELLAKKGSILVDTKYEFGLDSSGNLMLIDEIHTPDSSRFCYTKDYVNNKMRFPDKEFAREWLWDNGYRATGIIPELPLEIREKIRQNYIQLYETITRQKLEPCKDSVSMRLLKNLLKAGVIQESARIKEMSL